MKSAPEPLSAAHLAHQPLLHFAAAGAHGFEHFAHLSVLAEEVVGLLHRCARAQSAALRHPRSASFFVRRWWRIWWRRYRQRHWGPASLGIVCGLHEAARWCCLKT